MINFFVGFGVFLLFNHYWVIPCPHSRPWGRRALAALRQRRAPPAAAMADPGATQNKVAGGHSPTPSHSPAPDAPAGSINPAGGAAVAADAGAREPPPPPCVGNIKWLVLVFCCMLLYGNYYSYDVSVPAAAGRAPQRAVPTGRPYLGMEIMERWHGRGVFNHATTLITVYVPSPPFSFLASLRGFLPSVHPSSFSFLFFLFSFFYIFDRKNAVGSVSVQFERSARGKFASFAQANHKKARERWTRGFTEAREQEKHCS